MFKRLVRVAVSVLSAEEIPTRIRQPIRTNNVRLREAVDAKEQECIEGRMREHVEREDAWKRDLQKQAGPGDTSYLGRHGRPRP